LNQKIYHKLVVNIFALASIYQAPQSADGQQYLYNVSICGNSPYPCAGACSGANTAGVCQTWGNAPTNAKCCGKWDSTARVVGLSKYKRDYAPLSNN